MYSQKEEAENGKIGKELEITTIVTHKVIISH